ncbi:MAG TPA: hypothetical protein VMT10_06270, partial [Solirubrobacteraceae bacterium]|nr:hypothetical protein [Solirubrobacteraceae bacterium]
MGQLRASFAASTSHRLALVVDGQRCLESIGASSGWKRPSRYLGGVLTREPEHAQHALGVV